ncbi:MAG: CapA family protein [Clostridia bacterium]|nr:CapA family protein [Clostridia bacterium]
MAKKSTKYRIKTKLSKREMRRRQERMVAGVIYAFLAICVGAFASIGVSNSLNSRSASTQWIVREGEMEILAAPAGNTLGRTEAQAGEGLPFLQGGQATAAPQPTLVTLPTPVPEVAAEENELPALTPEQELDYVPITITAVGDCTLGGDVKSGGYRLFDEYVQQYGPDYFFENVRRLFSQDDLTIVNLEGPLTDSEDLRSGRAFNFRGDPEYVKILSGSSVEIANVANNHALDFGEEGLTETAEVLTEEGIGVSGFSRIYTTEVKGVKVCSIGFTEWAYSEDQIVQAVRTARENCDLLLVSVHWGEEKNYEATDTQVKLGRAIVDAGADVVIGNHSHVYGGVEQYKGKYIIYSLGNFCFGGNKNPGDKNCTIFQQTFVVSRDGTVSDGGINIIPARVSGKSNTNDFQPCILNGDAAAKQLSRIADVSRIDEDNLIWMEAKFGAVGAVALNSGIYN